jgi:hypothetical protein
LIRNRRPHKDARKRVLRQAEEKVTQPEYEQSDEITRIGIVWAGILDLDDILPPTTVAAMLSAAELVQATSTTNAEEHWIGAAAYAAMGAYSEIDSDEDDGKITVSTIQPAGFGAPSPPQP